MKWSRFLINVFENKKNFTVYRYFFGRAIYWPAWWILSKCLSLRTKSIILYWPNYQHAPAHNSDYSEEIIKKPSKWMGHLATTEEIPIVSLFSHTQFYLNPHSRTNSLDVGEGEGNVGFKFDWNRKILGKQTRTKITFLPSIHLPRYFDERFTHSFFFDQE